MALTRDLWLVLRARDEASRIVRSFGTNVGNAASRASKDVSEFERSMQAVSVRLNQFAQTSMLTGAVIAGFGLAGLGFIRSVTEVAAEYDKQVRRTLTQVDNVSISLQDVAKIGRTVAREVQVPFEQLQDTLFFIFSSIDVNAAQAQILLKAFAQEAVAGQASIESAAHSTISIMNALGLSVDDLTHIQDVQFQIVRKGIISYEELSTVIGRALPATARAGQSFETLGAMIAFLTRNGLSAAMASTSAARALESFANPVTVKRLEAIGISVRDAKGEFLPLVTVMEQMNRKLKDMASPERAKFIQELFTGAGGTIQARRFWDVAFKNFDDFESMVGNMKNSAGVFQNAYETMSGSVANQSELIRNKWMLIKEALGRALIPKLLELMQVLGKVLDWFDALPDSTKAIIAQFILWGSIIAILVGGLLILIGTLAFFVAGIMAAGTALVVVLGIISALIVAFAAIGVLVVVLWKHSEGFRGAVRQLTDNFHEMWSIIVTLAKDVKTAFDEKLGPSLKRFWDVVEQKVTPAVTKMGKMFKDEIIPKIQEAGRIVSDVAKTSFGIIADIIEKYVIPAIDKLSAWWDKNGNAIRPFLGIIGQVVKWLLIITAVIVAVPFVALAVMVAAVIVTITALVIALKKLWDWIVIAAKAVAEFFTNLVHAIVDWFNGLVDSAKQKLKLIQDAFKSAMKFINDIIDGALKFLYDNIWVPFWNTFGGLIKETWGLIGDIIKLFTVLIGEIIKDWVMPLIDIIVGAFKGIYFFFVNLWNQIVEIFQKKTAEASNWVSTKFDLIKTYVSMVFNEIKNIIMTILGVIYISVIKPAIDNIVEFWNNHLKGLWDRAVEIFNKIVDSIKTKVQEIKDFFKNAGEWLLNAGKNIIQGLIDGLTDKIKDLRKKLKEITDDIPKWKGPKSIDVRLLTPVGQDIMKSLMSGIQDQIPILQRQLQGITTQIGTTVTPSFTMPTNTVGRMNVPEQKTINQYITVNTKELNPRRQAADLGWELSGRL